MHASSAITKLSTQENRTSQMGKKKIETGQEVPGNETNTQNKVDSYNKKGPVIALKYAASYPDGSYLDYSSGIMIFFQ